MFNFSYVWAVVRTELLINDAYFKIVSGQDDFLKKCLDRDKASRKLKRSLTPYGEKYKEG